MQGWEFALLLFALSLKIAHFKDWLWAIFSCRTLLKNEAKIFFFSSYVLDSFSLFSPFLCLKANLSFGNCNGSDWLMVSFLKWATGAIRSQSLFCKKQQKQIGNVALKKVAKIEGNDSLLGIRRGKAVKNIQKIWFFFKRIAWYLIAIRWKHNWITHVTVF